MCRWTKRLRKGWRGGWGEAKNRVSCCRFVRTLPVSIFDFLTQDQIDDLPADDNDGAFLLLVRHAQKSLSDKTKGLDEEREEEWRQIQSLRHSFVNLIAAGARRYKIEPFASLEVPQFNRFNYDEYRLYRDDLDHYVAQLVLGASAKTQHNSVFVSDDARSTIRTYIHHLRETIDRADMSDSRREGLLRKLSEFEAELEKKRLSLIAVAAFSVGLLGAPAAIAESSEVIAKLVTQVIKVVGEAKSVEDEKRSVVPAERPPILPPRPPQPAIMTPVRESFSVDLDDEIPF